MKTKKITFEVPIIPRILNKEDYEFINFYCKAHLIPKGKGYENVLALFLEEYKLNKNQINKNTIDKFDEEFQRRLDIIMSRKYDVTERYRDMVNAIRKMYVDFNKDIYNSLKNRIIELEKLKGAKK